MLNPVEHWNGLVREAVAGATRVPSAMPASSADEREPARTHARSSLCPELAARMRERRLTFGGRLLCPFIRPFFLTADDERRVALAAEMLWTLGERVATAARETPALLQALGLSDEEARLARIDPGYGVASTTARADAFLLPDSLRFAEYNAEAPAGAAYSQGLAELFDGEPLMARFRERFETRFYKPVEALLDALLASYRDWGGSAVAPRIAIVDWREVPTWTEFELLRDAFTAMGVPTAVCDPRELVYDRSASAVSGSRGAGALIAAGAPVDLVYRRVLINDIVSRAEDCRALVDAYAAGAVCMANALSCKIAHKKAFFAVLTDERFARLFTPSERAVIERHIPWTRVVREEQTMRDGAAIDIMAHLRDHRERFVLKPNDEYGGTGVTLGWETSAAAWDDALERALAEQARGWVAQERIDVRREPFPVCDDGAIHERDMLVDFAPYLFRGRLAGFLTRLSATGLANVTSGGGQVPAFVLAAK